MIKATTKLADGTPALLLGLSEENLRRLRERQPISFDCAAIGLAPLAICIFWGPTEEQLEAELVETYGRGPRRRIGPNGDGRA